MKKILAIIAAAVAIIAAVTGCQTANQNTTGGFLIGTWTGTGQDGSSYSISFATATTATGVVTYGGQVIYNLKIAYAMTDASTGSGTAVMTNPLSDKIETTTFTMVLIAGELYVTIPDIGTIKLTKSSQPVTPSGGGSSLAGSSWKSVEDEYDYLILTFTTASSGTGYYYDEGQLDGQFTFTYTMASATSGSGSIVVQGYYGQSQPMPLKFIIVGSEMYVTITMSDGGASTNVTYTFTRVS